MRRTFCYCINARDKCFGKRMGEHLFALQGIDQLKKGITIQRNKNKTKHPESESVDVAMSFISIKYKCFLHFF